MTLEVFVTKRPAQPICVPISARGVACSLWLLTAVLSAPAGAWQQYVTSQGEPMRWSARSLAGGLPYTLDEHGLPPGQPGLAQVEAAAEAATAVWHEVVCEPCELAHVKPACQPEVCGARPLGVDFNYLGRRPTLPIGLLCLRHDDLGGCIDAEPNGNQIIFIRGADRWPYGSLTVAMTIISALPHDGFIADGDITLNAAHFTFCADGCKALQPGLKATLVHEIGHLLGLDHSLQKAAAMHAAADVLGGAQLALGADDRAGICTAYGHAPPTPACPPTGEMEVNPDDGGGCCSASHTRQGPWSALGLLSLCLLALLACGHQTGLGGHDSARAA